MKNMKTGRSKCFGFVEFRTAEAASRILSKKHVLNGRVLDLNHAFKKGETTNTTWNKILISKRAFLTGIDQNLTSDHLVDYFSRFGKVEKANIILDPDTNRTKDFGYVNFCDSRSLAKAIQQTKHSIRGCQVLAFRYRMNGTRFSMGKNKANSRRDTGMSCKVALAINERKNKLLD